MTKQTKPIRLLRLLLVLCVLSLLSCSEQKKVETNRVARNGKTEEAEAPDRRIGVSESIDGMVATEDLALAFMPQLHAASKSLSTGSLSPLRLSKSITVAKLHEASSDETKTIEGVSRRKWKIDARQEVDSGQWTALAAWRTTVEKITFAKLKFVRGRVEGDRFSGDYQLEAKANLNDGMQSSLQARVQLVFHWSPAGISKDHGDPKNWVLENWVLLEASEDRGKPLFRSVARKALPDETVYRRALRSKEKEIVREMALQGTVSLKTSNRRLPLFPDLQSTYQTPGLAVVDVNQDGWEDLYLVGRFGPNILLRNNQDGTFTDVAAELGLDIEGFSNAALFADFDNDGDADVFVGRTLERTVYLENDGGIFRDRSRKVFGGDLPFLVSAIAAADYDGDGLLDVFFATYSPSMKSRQRLQSVVKSFEFPPPVAKAMQARFVSQHGFLDRLGPPNILLRNTGTGFEVAPESAVLDRLRNSYSCSWSDYDGDGDQDLYVANDYAPDEFYRNNGAGTGSRFTEVSQAISNNKMNGFGMGVTWGDYDEDGAIDLYVSNMFSKAGRRITDQLEGLDTRIPYAAQGSLLFRQTEDGLQQVAGLGPDDVHVSKVGWSYGGIFCDINNDGRLDLYSASGYYTPPQELDTYADT